jgi:hypothetical protein
MVAVALHLSPAEVWGMDSRDMATVVAILEEQSKRR